MDKVSAAVGFYREAQAKARTALQTEPFDQAALDGALADIRVKREVVQRVLQAVVSKAAPAMSPDGRKRMAEWTGVKGSS